MRQTTRIALMFALVVFSTLCWADIPVEVVQRAKLATALVEVEMQEDTGEGSAFCIDTSGLFVTNAHVVEDLRPGGKLMLVLHSGEPDQKKAFRFVSSPWIRMMTTWRSFRAAPRPPTNQPEPGQQRRGRVWWKRRFPSRHSAILFGTDLALKDGDFPNITVSTGHITSLRKANGKLSLIQLDATLNPGNSGGPILNDKGDVIGIVMEGIPGSGIRNLAIPVNFLKISACSNQHRLHAAGGSAGSLKGSSGVLNSTYEAACRRPNH